MNKILIGLILFVWVFSDVAAQKNQEYKIFSKFRKLSIIGGPVLYNKGKIYPQYGDYTFENKPIWSFNAGLEYDFYPDRKWSVITGMIVGMEYVYHIQCTFKKEDIYSQFTEDFTDEFKMSAMLSLAAPLLLKTNLIYTMNFQNTIEGFYKFENLLSSPPSGGDYELSGNYLALWISVTIAKKKIKG